jgi:rubrerythrin
MKPQSEQQELLTALLEAEKMEVEGKEFYLKMSLNSVNERGRQLFRILAEEEDNHRQDFRQIYQSLLSEKETPDLDFPPEKENRLHSLFPQTVEEVEKEIKAPKAELEAIDTAIGMEKQGIDFYFSQASKAYSPKVRRFYRELVLEEKRHKATLEDYRKYVIDPAGWLVSKTMPSLGCSLLPNSTGNVSDIEW